MLLYSNLFYSFVSYGITVWSLNHPTILDRFCKLQNKVIRAVKFKDNYTHATPLFYDLKFLKLHDIHTLNLLCFVYNCRHQNSIHPFNDFFVPVSASHNHGIRQASRGDIFMQRFNTTHYGKRSTKYAGAILWNDLAPAMREIPLYKMFKKQLQPFYLASYASINLTGYHPPGLTPWPLIFSVKIPSPGTAFQCKTRAPGSKKRNKIPTPGHNLPSSNVKISMK